MALGSRLEGLRPGCAHRSKPLCHTSPARRKSTLSGPFFYEGMDFTEGGANISADDNICSLKKQRQQTPIAESKAVAPGPVSGAWPTTRLLPTPRPYRRIIPGLTLLSPQKINWFIGRFDLSSFQWSRFAFTSGALPF